MILWKKDFNDTEEIRRKVSNGYTGIKQPEKIQGFAGYFLFCFGDIYVSEEVFSLFDTDRDFEKFVSDCLDKFKALDYGIATKDEQALNIENRLFFGINFQLVGRYQTKYGTLKVEVPKFEKTEISLIKED